MPKRLLEEALRADPDYASALALLSQVNVWLYFLGENQNPQDGVAARQAFERAFALEPDLPEATLARGLYTMYVANDPDRALADLDTVVRSRPNSAEVHEVLAYALRRRGRMDEALEHLMRALELDPLNDTVRGGAITTVLGLRRYPEAIALTETETKRYPNHADSYLARARIQAFVQHSVEPLRAALREHADLLDPTDHKAVEAEIARAEGRYLDAVKIWDSIHVEDPLARGERIGALYLAAGDGVHAVARLRAAERYVLGLKRKPHVDELMQLAMVQSMLGEHAAALQSIEAVRIHNPEARDATNGPAASLARSVILVRAGRTAEGYAEVTRLLHVPYGAPIGFFEDPDPMLLLMKDDAHYDELLNRPPRL